jgi:hypothetical protein
MNLLRGTLSFLLNLLQAAWGTGLIISAFRVPAKTMLEHVVHEDLLSILVAGAVGFVVYYLRQPAASKWVWFFGICWLVFHMIPVVAEGEGAVRFQFSGVGCASHPSPTSCHSWLGVTLPFIRTFFYSAGAFCCSWIRPNQPKREAAGHDPKVRP